MQEIDTCTFSQEELVMHKLKKKKKEKEKKEKKNCA
jgi:hypothetical protein